MVNLKVANFGHSAVKDPKGEKDRGIETTHHAFPSHTSRFSKHKPTLPCVMK